MVCSIGLDDKAITRLFGVAICHKIPGPKKWVILYIIVIDYQSYVYRVGGRKDMDEYLGILQVSLYNKTQ